MADTLLKTIEQGVELHRDPKTGIAWVKNGKTGLGHSAHGNIDASGSVEGMKARGYWSKEARTVRSHGFIYNIDTFVVSNELDELCAEHCECQSCLERKEAHVRGW